MATAHTAELTSINLSLFTLGRCIAALSAKAPATYIPYRESKLTRCVGYDDPRTCAIKESVLQSFS